MSFFSATGAVIEGLLLPLLLGFVVKVIFVIKVVLLKLLFIGIKSLGLSGLSLILATMFAKKEHLQPPLIHYRMDRFSPNLYKPPFKNKLPHLVINPRRDTLQ